ncbi:MAG: hypothetical protein ACKV2T_19780 [Kofleriaceae bacterium]
MTVLLSCATGVGVYLYLKDHYAHLKVARAEAPRPAPAPPPVAVQPAAIPPEPPAPVPVILEPPPVVEPPADPDTLTTEQVRTTVDAARQRFADCAVVGELTLVLRIRPSGRVEQVGVVGTDSDEMRTCVTDAAKRIRFPKSTKGLTMRYSLAGE